MSPYQCWLLLITVALISTIRCGWNGIWMALESHWRRRWHPTQVLLPGKSMDGGAWWAVVHGVAKSQTRLSDFTFTFMHWRRKWQPTPVFLPGESQGWGDWWAAVYGVAQSRTQLKWLSRNMNSLNAEDRLHSSNRCNKESHSYFLAVLNSTFFCTCPHSLSRKYTLFKCTITCYFVVCVLPHGNYFVL